MVHFEITWERSGIDEKDDGMCEMVFKSESMAKVVEKWTLRDYTKENGYFMGIWEISSDGLPYPLVDFGIDMVNLGIFEAFFKKK